MSHLRMTEEQFAARQKRLATPAPKSRKRDLELVTRAVEREAREKWERMLLSHIVAAQLPEPQLQFRFSTKRQFRLDFAWADQTLGVEVEGGIWRKGGGAHSHPSNIERDIEKHNLMAMEGWALIRVTPKMIQSGEALQLIEAYLKR